ncbi:MAG: recombinase family protein [Microbacterium sp.]|nr:recombinase family protein [Microbacterium sp.]
MRETYELRVRRKGLPAGPPPYGFARDWSHHPTEAPIVRAIFTEYATTDTSLRLLAERYGLRDEHVKVMIRNPAYVGRAQHNGSIHPGSMKPIVDEATWNAVVAKRETNRFVTGGVRPQHPTPWRGRLFCQCGARIRFNGVDKYGHHRILHLDPCRVWGHRKPRKRLVAGKRLDYVVAPLREAVRGLWGSYGAVVEGLDADPAPPPVLLDHRPTRERLARRFAKGELALDDFTAHIAALDAQEATQVASPQPAPTRNELHAYWAPFETADYDQLAAGLFERVEYRGPTRLALTLTPEAQRYRVAAVLPQVVDLVGGEGLEPPTSSV